MIYWLCQEKIL